MAHILLIHTAGCPFVGTGLTAVSHRRLYNPPIVRYNGMKYRCALCQPGRRMRRTACPLFAVPGGAEGEQRGRYVTP